MIIEFRKLNNKKLSKSLHTKSLIICRLEKALRLQRDNKAFFYILTTKTFDILVTISFIKTIRIVKV